jgi:hypothetical protein
MGFSVLVEFLNIRTSRKKAEPVILRDPYASRVELTGPPAGASDPG